MREDDITARAAQIGDAALDFDSESERNSYIDQECGGDGALKLLVREYVAGGEADTPLFDGATVPMEAAADSRIGQVVGHWRLLRIVGEGGFGVVYLAERSDGQVRQLGAVKFLRGTVRSREFELRFRDERQILANLHCPYIVGLIDAGVTREGQPYLVMEFVEDAEPIDVYCRDRGLPVRECLKLFQMVCEAVAHAHQKLIIHRDLKPENILVTKDGVPHLLDFGVAKILDPIHRSGERAAASTNVLVGTERYFSPEQARREPVDTTTDIYSLGVILYELLTGADPYELHRWPDEPIEQIVCTVDPEIPSKVVLRTCMSVARETKVRQDSPTSRQHVERKQSDLKGDVDAIVMMALRKERERRYRTVVELNDDIGRHLANRPILARRESFAYWAQRFVRRYRAQITGAAVGLSLSTLAVGAIYVVNQLRPSQYRYTIAGRDGPASRYTVDDYLLLKVNGKPVGYGKFTGCGPATTPSRCPESAAIAFIAAQGGQLEIVAYDIGGGYLLSELWLYKNGRRAMKLTDEIKPCETIPCSWDKWRPQPAIFFGRTFSLP